MLDGGGDDDDSGDHDDYNAQCVHCTVGFPCSKNSPVLATGEFLNPHC